MVKQADIIKTQAEALIYFIQTMDIEMVNDLLDENLRYQYMKKDVFVQNLQLVMKEFEDAGDTYLHMYKGACNGKDCNLGCKGYMLVGNKSGNYLPLIVEVKDGKVTDVYECAEFLSAEPVEKKKRLIIDKLNYPF